MATEPISSCVFLDGDGDQLVTCVFSQRSRIKDVFLWIQMTAFKPSSLWALSHDSDECGFSTLLQVYFVFLNLDMEISVS